MKKYVVFGYDQYYPGGGTSDIRNSFDTLEDCMDFLNTTEYKNDHYEIVDRDTWEDVPYNKDISFEPKEHYVYSILQPKTQ